MQDVIRVVADDGSALVIAPSGDMLLRAAAPWAVDAEGTAVPTHCEVGGNKLVQVVDHTAGDYAHPIVADPRLDSGVGCTSIFFNRHETETIASSGIVALFWGAPGTPVFGCNPFLHNGADGN